ncbi:hypothetical protein [Rummeliibacillus pycnus]|uniref:hypothetical protein n=1 Tax=Rummeliibacillus pycnus TaxID=101070 RepID=UPI003D2CBBDE
MVKMNGRIIFHGTLLAGLLICTSIGHLITNSEATPSMKAMEMKQHNQKTTINMKEKIDQVNFIEKATAQLEKNGYQVGFVLSITSNDQKELKAVVRSQIKDKETAIHEITQMIDDLASENKLGMFTTTVNFPDD